MLLETNRIDHCQLIVNKQDRVGWVSEILLHQQNYLMMLDEKVKTKYSDSELAELRDNAAITGKILEDGSATMQKEQANQLTARQKKFKEQLEAAVPNTTQSMEAEMKQS